MEEEEARDYNEPCVECSVVSWGITEEGKFYCRSCHTVIERTREVLTGDVTSNARAQSISRGLKKKNKLDKGWEWYVCEGFQYILWKQAEALQSLGVSSQMKEENYTAIPALMSLLALVSLAMETLADGQRVTPFTRSDGVLANFWRRYLQKSKQAYCDKPFSDATYSTSPKQLQSTDTEEEPDFIKLLDLVSSATDTDLLSESSIGGISSSKISGFSQEKSVWSGSVDGSSYIGKRKKGDMRMSMPMTLAFCYLALLWLRESITLSDLLR
ncbi:TATA box-binding protein-associated factor RNA polymerase I subunit B [Varanus komodoensis]|nr:TATA box-binding protein-associated factor RNA polymerase I subunit B [Varanus komodoensis]